MPERAASDAALRFVHDLRSLREEREIPLTALHDATRVPTDVLDAFETTALHGNRLFNRVYLRSLVRGYAAVIGLEPDRALVALEEALAGQYDGALLREPEPSGIEEGSGAPDALPPLEAGAAPQIAPADDGERTRFAGATTDETAEETTDRPREALLAPPAAPEPEEPPRGERSVDESYAATSPPRAMPPAGRTPGAERDAGAPRPIAWDAISGSTRNPRVPPPRETPWGAILGSAAVLALLVAAAFWWFNRSPAPPAAEPEPVAATEPAPRQAAPVVPVNLPDTLVLRVTATNGPVSDIKIQRDDDLRRPYWLEQGVSRDFPFVNRAVIERELADATFMVNGRPYPTTRQDSLGRLVITRDTVLRLFQQP